MERKGRINPKILAVTFALVTLVLDAAGYIWHGLLGQPSTMNLLYSGFWGNPTLLALGLIGSLIGAYAAGYFRFQRTHFQVCDECEVEMKADARGFNHVRLHIFASIYNWANKEVN